MNNTFDDKLPDALRIPNRKDKSAIDVHEVRSELSRAVGWYRKESAERVSHRDKREEAEEITSLLMQLYERMEPHVGGMSPLLRSLVLENMRHLGIPMPEFGKLAACVENAGSQLPAVKSAPAATTPEATRRARSILQSEHTRHRS